MALPSDADIPRILSQIRPGADWGWAGNGSTFADPADLDWRDQVQTEPTLQELEDGWNTILNEETAQLTVKQQLKADYLSLVGSTFAGLTTAQLKTILEIHQYVLGGLDKTTRQLKPVSEWKTALDNLGL